MVNVYKCVNNPGNSISLIYIAGSKDLGVYKTLCTCSILMLLYVLSCDYYVQFCIYRDVRLYHVYTLLLFMI